jgi:phosphate transport system substrate-binding protein
VGSGEGTKRFIAETVDFGASDAAMSDAEIARVARGVQLIPTTAGSIALAYNLEGLGGEVRLSRDVYVDIFLGEITRWDDQRIKRANPHLTMPKLDISVVARLDGSGTTYAFTKHLSEISEEWANRGPGTGKLIDWPGSAMLANGNAGVSGLIKRTPGAIGYVEYGIASRAGLALAHLQNRDGNFVPPTGASGMATLLNAELPDNLRAFFPDPRGKESYPIVTYTWYLLYKTYDDIQVRDELKAFVHWCLTDGQQFNEDLGYIQLPDEIAKQALEALDGVQ